MKKSLSSVDPTDDQVGDKHAFYRATVMSDRTEGTDARF